ncbi:MAG: acyl-CoA thioesterase [Bacteroidia bacterium]
MEGYNTELVLRLDWSEMDLFGHINNVSFGKYVQASRVNYWEEIGFTKMHTESKIGPLLASTSIQFKKPLFYPGQITICAKIGFVKTTSFSIQHVILNGDNETVAEAEDVVVLFDFNKNEKTPLPRPIIEAMEKREKRKFRE